MKDIQDKCPSWMPFLSFHAAHGCRVITESAVPVMPEVGEAIDLEACLAFPLPDKFEDEGR